MLMPKIHGGRSCRKTTAIHRGFEPDRCFRIGALAGEGAGHSGNIYWKCELEGVDRVADFDVKVAEEAVEQHEFVVVEVEPTRYEVLVEVLVI